VPICVDHIDRTVTDLTNTGTAGSNPHVGMRLYSVSVCSCLVNRFYVVQQPQNRVCHIRKDQSLSELIRVGKDQKFHFAQTDDTQANNTGKGTQANGITLTYTVIRSLNRMNAYLMYNAIGNSFR
jgi:hypothetical protein